MLLLGKPDGACIVCSWMVQGACKICSGRILGSLDGDVDPA